MQSLDLALAAGAALCPHCWGKGLCRAELGNSFLGIFHSGIGNKGEFSWGKYLTGAELGNLFLIWGFFSLVRKQWGI